MVKQNPAGIDPKVQEGMELVDSMDDTQLALHIDYIRYTLGERKRRKNAVVRSQIVAGKTRVRFDGPRKPQYLSGLEGTIEEIRQTRVVVKLDCGPVGKFRNGRLITNPGSLTILDS